ncbi:MAG: signal peptidase II [Phenylobacterium sp.]|uniref:signal peptidase II n=1 Tax=Phenylobacterium sp. TaxID=1871053 RepID=UPI002733675F|nr:signal peptidase II [Phenylobacterium sp.]MDP3175992.1 signal peptidase II [Phenylobacterium sp.]
MSEPGLNAPVSRYGWQAYILATAVLALDQAVKHWVLNGLNLGALGAVQVAGPLHLTLVWNRGVSFGLFHADRELMRWALAAFSLIVAVVLVVWARRSERSIVGAGLGLIIGGAIGNAVDRVRFGAVVDFIDVSRLYFPWVFNVADAAITVGVGLLLLDSVRKERTAP